MIICVFGDLVCGRPRRRIGTDKGLRLLVPDQRTVLTSQRTGKDRTGGLLPQETLHHTRSGPSPSTGPDTYDSWRPQVSPSELYLVYEIRFSGKQNTVWSIFT